MTCEQCTAVLRCPSKLTHPCPYRPAAVELEMLMCLPTAADIVTGKPAQELRYHREIVRDLSWHPYLPMMVTSAFDGSVVQWDPRQSVDEEASRGVCTKRRRQLPEPGEDRLEDFY